MNGVLVFAEANPGRAAASTSSNYNQDVSAERVHEHLVRFATRKKRSKKLVERQVESSSVLQHESKDFDF